MRAPRVPDRLLQVGEGGCAVSPRLNSTDTNEDLVKSESGKEEEQEQNEKEEENPFEQENISLGAARYASKPGDCVCV